MSKKIENQGFTCNHCNRWVNSLSNGSYRNHCPYCLYSKHVDINPGDRRNPCKGLLEPIGVKNTSKKGMQLIHKCKSCGKIRLNKVATDDPDPDNFDEIINMVRGCL